MQAVRPEFLALVRCPATGQSLENAPDDLVGELNARIARGTLRNAAGDCLPGALDGALVSQDGLRAYPVVAGVVLMLTDDAIALPLAPDGEPS